MENKRVEGVSIIIPNYNGKYLLEQFLPSVFSARSSYKGKTEIIVVDDNSTDGSIEFLNGLPDMRVVKRKGERGFSITCNEGAKSARNDILLFLNNDVKVDINFISPLIEHFSNKNVFAVTCKAFNYPDKSFRDGGKAYEFSKGFFKVHHNYDITDINNLLVKNRQLLSFMFSAAFSAVRRDMFIELGGFDEEFSPFNWEDADLSYRAWKRGFEIHYEPRSIVYHIGNTTINKSHKKLNVVLISKRNRLIMMWKNLRDPGFIIRHIIYLIVWSILYACILNFIEIDALFRAILHLPHILRERKKEKPHIKRSDKEIMKTFQAFMGKGDLNIKN